MLRFAAPPASVPPPSDALVPDGCPVSSSVRFLLLLLAFSRAEGVLDWGAIADFVGAGAGGAALGEEVGAGFEVGVAVAEDDGFFLTMPFSSDFWSFLPTVGFGLVSEAAVVEVDVDVGVEVDGVVPDNFRWGGPGAFVAAAGVDEEMGDVMEVDVDRSVGGLFIACSRAATALTVIRSMRSATLCQE